MFLRVVNRALPFWYGESLEKNARVSLRVKKGLPGKEVDLAVQDLIKALSVNLL